MQSLKQNTSLCLCVGSGSLLIQEDLGQFWFSQKLCNNFVVWIDEKTEHFSHWALTSLINILYNVILLTKDIATQEHGNGREIGISFQASIYWAHFIPFIFLVVFLFLIITRLAVFYSCRIRVFGIFWCISTLLL